MDGADDEAEAFACVCCDLPTLICALAVGLCKEQVGVKKSSSTGLCAVSLVGYLESRNAAPAHRWLR